MLKANLLTLALGRCLNVPGILEEDALISSGLGQLCAIGLSVNMEIF